MSYGHAVRDHDTEADSRRGEVSTEVQEAKKSSAGGCLAAVVILGIIVAVTWWGCSACMNGPKPGGTTVATFSGGGSDVVDGTTDTFTVSSEKQVLSCTMPEKGSLASLNVFVIDADTNMTAEQNSFLDEGTYGMSLKPGAYYIAWKSGDCRWEMTVSED